MEARRGLGQERHRCIIFAVRDSEVLQIGARGSTRLLPPAVGRQIQIRRTHQISYSAALVRFFYSSPEAVKFGAKRVGFVEQDDGPWQQIEHGTVSPGDRRVKLPSRKYGDTARADGGFDDFVGRPSNAFARKSGVNGAEQLVADRSFRKRQKERFVDRVRRTL